MGRKSSYMGIQVVGPAGSGLHRLGFRHGLVGVTGGDQSADDAHDGEGNGGGGRDAGEQQVEHGDEADGGDDAQDDVQVLFHDQYSFR